MFRSVRLLAAATVFTVAGAAVGDDHAPKPPCPPLPGPKVVVELQPPVVTFKPAPPTVVRAPAPTMHCFPVTMPGPPVPTYAPSYAPSYAPNYAPAYAPPAYGHPGYAPAPVYAPVYPQPAMYAPAPGYGYAPAPAMAYAPAPQPAFAPAPMPPAAPTPGFAPAPCGSQPAFGLGGFGPPSGLGSSADDLAALTEGRLAYERAVLRRQYALAREQMGALEKHAAAYGLAPASPDGEKPKGTTVPAGPPAAPARPADAGDTPEVLKEIRELKQHIDNLYKLANYQVIELEKLKKGAPPK